MCKVIWLDPRNSARSRFELPANTFRTQDQLDEMVAFGFVQLTREVAQLKQAGTATAGQSEKKPGGKIYARTFLEVAKFGIEVANAIQGN